MTIEAQLARIIELLEAKNATASAAASPVVADAPTAVAAAPTAPAEAPAKRRGRPPKQVAAAAPETVAPAAAPAQAAPATGTSCSPDEKVYTDSDLRTALTQASTRLGSKEKVVALLQKYAGADKPPIVASIAVADYGKVVTDCAALA